MNLIEAILDFIRKVFGHMDTGPLKEAIIKDAILKGIVEPLKLPLKCVDILFAQAILETGHFTAWYFQGLPQKDGLPPTYSLFNRHKGSGLGEWTGQTKYISPGDADVRIFTDVYQSARDMRQLLTDPHYGPSLLALRVGNAGQYYDELQKAGFSVSMTYAAGLKRTFEKVIA